MRKVLVALLVVLALAGGGLATVALHDPGGVRPPTPAQPSPYPTRTPLLAAGESGSEPTPTGLRAALAQVLRDRRLGTRMSLSVVDVPSQRVLLERGATREVTPASTAKIATAVAVLATLPWDRRLVTTVVEGARGEVVLVGAGDPTLAGRATVRTARGARLSDLAVQVRAWARTSGTSINRVRVDDALFTGPRVGPAWKPGYVQHGDVAPVSALAVDGGRVSKEAGSARTADPALEAGHQLARLLGVREVSRGRAAPGAAVLARVRSTTVADLVEQMLTRSDNDLAEALGRQVALALHRPASFVGEAAAITQALRQHGVQVRLRDASGLSPLNRVQPGQLTRLLASAAHDGRYAPLMSGLPVAGFDGTLSDRYRAAPSRGAAGQVRAKTGTLDGVSALAGYVRTRSGRLLAFDLTADGVRLGGTAAAQAALDRVAAALAGCGCG